MGMTHLKISASVKRARVLSQNQITEIVIDSESDEENYACKELKPRPQCK